MSALYESGKKVVSRVVPLESMMTMIHDYNNESVQCSHDLRELEPGNVMRS